jgi:hypothetical protein
VIPTQHLYGEVAVYGHASHQPEHRKDSLPVLTTLGPLNGGQGHKEREKCARKEGAQDHEKGHSRILSQQGKYQ